MKNSDMGLFAVAVALVFAGALLAGVPFASLVPLLILLACPLMMVLMMSGMRGDHGAEHRDSDARRDGHPHR